MDLRVFIYQTLLFFATNRLLPVKSVNGFALPPEDIKCQYSRPKSLLKIRCYNMNLKEVPQYLKTSVEVLDLSYNRIKKLKVNSFEKYGGIKFLLLYENMIQSVEPGTFRHLKSLQEIDLSNNGLLTIPLELFQLPSLRNLYVDSNELINLPRDLESLEKPITAPLEYLNVADCTLEDLPDLGVLPKLWHINASRNPLTELTMSKFANMCSLKTIDLTQTKISNCMCQQVNEHFTYVGAKMKFVPVCKEQLNADDCPSILNQTALSPEFEVCNRTPTKAEVKRFWYFVVGCICGVILVLLLLSYCIYRIRRRKQRAKAAKATRNTTKNLVISPKNAINNRDPNNRLLRYDEKSDS